VGAGPKGRVLSMADTETDGRLPRAHRAGIILAAVGVIAVLWCIAKAASGPGDAPTQSGVTLPPYMSDGSPPWTWPKAGGTDIWTDPDPWQPWPPEWMTN
jgi:hypothetical protein